jgi:hypothetical protein
MNEPRWISVEAVARCYDVELDWLLLVVDSGALRGVQQRDNQLRIAENELDRIAAAVRWHRHLALEMEVVTAMLLLDRA